MIPLYYFSVSNSLTTENNVLSGAQRLYRVRIVKNSRQRPEYSLLPDQRSNLKAFGFVSLVWQQTIFRPLTLATLKGVRVPYITVSCTVFGSDTLNQSLTIAKILIHYQLLINVVISLTFRIKIN